MTCQEASEQLSDPRYPTLRGLPRARVWAHLLICKHCRAFAQQMRHTVTILRGLDQQVPPPSSRAADRRALFDKFTPR